MTRDTPLARSRRFVGVRFSRPPAIRRYIADFCARPHKVIIAIDGGTHTDQARDAQRTAARERMGYRVIRFSNADVMTNLDGMLHAIGAARAVAPNARPLSAGEREPRA